VQERGEVATRQNKPGSVGHVSDKNMPPASLAQGVAGRAARLESARAAHDDLIAAAHRAQANAQEIEASATRRLADEYDAAPACGDIAGHGGGRNFKVSDGNVETPPDGRMAPDEITRPSTAAQIGLSRKAIHDARQIRDAETAEPGLVRRTLDAQLERGEEPTRSALRRAADARLERSQQIAVFGMPEDRAIHEGRVSRATRLAPPEH